MTTHSTEIAILGSGFAGSLLAMGAARLGRDVLVLDKARHPRFAIGESSTPVANRVLRDLAVGYDLPRVLPLAKYGSWQRAYPEIGCGLKRGFSYFEHHPGQSYVPDRQHGNELLVAASSDDESSDTQWLRADVDQFLVEETRRLGVPVWESARLESLEQTDGGEWILRGERSRDDRETSDPASSDPATSERFTVRARFLVDGTGEASLVASHLGVAPRVERLHTRSRSLFAHFRGVGSWSKWLAERGGDIASHPFSCDDAAQHMLLDGAWMWVLRFGQGLTSVGLAIDEVRHPLPEDVTPEAEWRQWLARYPSVSDLLVGADLANPPGRLVRTGRIQRRAGRAVGKNWAALPHTAGFIDPLHSSGIAHSLCGVERLLDCWRRAWGRAEMTGLLDAYERSVFRELELIDLLVHGCYSSLGRFRRFVTWSMLYFAAATTYERRRADTGYDADQLFLNAGDDEFLGLIVELHRELSRMERTTDAERRFEAEVARRLAPYNHVGLFDPSVHNMYRHTVAP